MSIPVGKPNRIGQPGRVGHAHAVLITLDILSNQGNSNRKHHTFPAGNIGRVAAIYAVNRWGFPNQPNRKANESPGNDL